jgi:hypothetical protein
MFTHKRLWTLLAIVCVFWLAACGGNATEEAVVLPTVMVLPTLTPSDTPTKTPTPTVTPSVTNSPTPTFTSTFTPTATYTPSVTNTATLTPTFTNTPTPTVTNTATVTPTPPTPQIISFTASATNVTANAPITLTWQTAADAARIEVLNAQTTVLQVFTVTPNGSLPVTVPGGQGSQIIYRLVASRGGQDVSQSIPIIVSCPIAWFFGNERAPAGSGCPTAVGAIAAGAYQGFQRGVMIYTTANGANKVYGLQNQNKLWVAYTSAWDGTTVYNCGGTPPPGAFAAQGVFSWAYCNTNAPIGTWYDPNGAIGWAITGLDSGPRTVQTSDTGMIFIDAPGLVFRLNPGGPGAPNGSWACISVSATCPG